GDQAVACEASKALLSGGYVTIGDGLRIGFCLENRAYPSGPIVIGLSKSKLKPPAAGALRQRPIGCVEGWRPFAENRKTVQRRVETFDLRRRVLGGGL